MNNTNWTTFYGKTIKLTELSHQHLSNILYYFDLVLGFNNANTHGLSHIKNELDMRFGGIKLPYHPMVSFTQEIDELVRKGYTTGELDANIVVDSKWVGSIKYN